MTQYPNFASVAHLARAAAGLLLSCLAAPSSSAQAPQNLAELDRQLGALFTAGAVPGATVVLIENGQISFEKGYGFADVARRIPATPQTPFRAASIAKSLTAIGVMTLVEQGRLTLDTPVRTIAPEVAFSNPWEKTAPLRLVHLLEHTSGWPDISTRVLAKSERTWSTLQGLTFSSGGFTSRWQPGLFPVYSNAGAAVAGYAMEKVTGQPFDRYMRSAVLAPLGMRDADFTLTPALAARMAKSYGADGSVTPYQHIVLKPAGSLVVSAHELAQLARLYIGRGSVDGRQLLTAASVARLERAESTLASPAGFTNGYGLGTTPIADSGITFRGHNGSIDSFTSVLGYSLRNGSGYVLMANGGAGVDFAQPAAQLVQAWLTRGLALDPAPTVALDQHTLEKYAGYYRSITPDNDLMRPYAEMFGISHVVAAQGKLVIGGKDYMPTGQHSFRRADRSQATVGFVEKDGELYKINPLSAQRKVALWHVAGLWLVGAVLALGLLFGLAMLIPWTISHRRGNLASRGGLGLRLLPLGAVTGLLLTLALPLMALSGVAGSSVHSVSNVGPYSLLIVVCSLLYPMLAAAGLTSALRRHQARRLVRLYAGATSLTMLLLAAYAALVGWLPLLTWTM